jgi:hypothetical protein
MRVFRWIIWAVFFLGLPLWFVRVGITAWFQARDERMVSRLAESQEKAFAVIRRFEKTEEFLAQLLFRQARSSDSSSSPVPVLKEGLETLSRRLPIGLKWAVTDGQGTLQRDFAPLPPQAPVRKLFEYCRDNLQSTAYGFVIPPQGENLIRAFVGPEVHIPSLPHLPRKLIRSHPGTNRRWFWWYVGKRLGLFVHLDHHPNWEDLAIDLRLRGFQQTRTRGPLRIGVWRPGLPVPGRDVSLALEEFRRSNRSTHVIQGSLVQVQALESTSLLWASLPLAPYLTPLQTFFWLDLLLVLTGLGLSSLLIPLNSSTRDERPSSIRWQMGILFFYAAALPLLFLFRWVWEHLEQRQSQLVQEMQDLQVGRLRAIDLGLPRLRKRTERLLTQGLKTITVHQAANLGSIWDYLERIFKRTNSTGFQVFDSAGKVVYRTRARTSKRPGNVVALGKIAASLITRLNGTDPGLQGVAREAVMESFGGINLVGELVGTLAAWLIIRSAEIAVGISGGHSMTHREKSCSSSQRTGKGITSKERPSNWKSGACKPSASPGGFWPPLRCAKKASRMTLSCGGDSAPGE